MDIHQHIRQLDEQRHKAWSFAQAHMDECQRRHPRDQMNIEERAIWDRMNRDLDDLDAEIRGLRERADRENQSGVIRESLDRQYGSLGAFNAEKLEGDRLRRWALGEGPKAFGVDIAGAQRRAHAMRQGAGPRDLLEERSLLWDTGSSGSLLPTLLSHELYKYLEYGIAAFRMPTHKLPTPNGDPIGIPKLGAHAIATQVIAQGTAVGGTDPTFALTTMQAYKYGELVQVSSEVVNDSVIDIVTYLAADVGRAVARKADVDLITGGGSTNPQGMTTANTTGAAGTQFTGGTSIKPQYADLINLVYGVNDSYRASGNAAFLMHDSIAASIRALRSDSGGTSGIPLWQPGFYTAGITGGQPDRLLDQQVFVDANCGTAGSANKVIWYGDWDSYWLRTVGDFLFERSDDYAFNTDLVTFRGKWRLDGRFVDLNAVTALRMSIT